MKKFDRTKLAYICLAVFMAGLFLFFSWARVFDEFEYSTLDFRYRLRPPQKVDSDIVIVEIGDDSIEKLGKWPFPRNYHALVVNALKSSNVKTIVFDVFFSEEKEGDEEFAEAIKDAGNVYLPYVFELNRDPPDRTRVYATGYAAELLDIFKKVARGIGFINVEPDIDGKIRRVPPFIEYKNVLYPHITVLVALNNLGYRFDEVKIIPGKRMMIGEDLVIPLDSDSSMLVDYPAVWGKAFRHYSYVDIIQSYLADVTGQKPILDLNELGGTICFIGLTATAAPDAHPSPMEPLYPGIGVHTSIYNSIMSNIFLRRLNRWWNLLILIVLWFLTGYLTSKSRKRFAILSMILLTVLFIMVAIFMFWPLGIWIDLFYPIISCLGVYIIFTFKKYITETQKREIIEKELNIAREIQESFLPKEIPQVGGLEVSVKMLTARQVGGDLYDIEQLDDNKLGIMIGDVSGKGVPAALYMSRVVSVFKTYMREGTASEVVKNINNRLVAEAASNLFVTLAYMVFDTEKKIADFAMGGHLPTIVMEPDGNIELLDVSEGMPLGLIEGDFSPGRKEYKPGSIFVFYTDGVTEAMNIKEEMFGQDRLVKLVKGLRGRSTQEIVDSIHKVIGAFEGKGNQHDDITVMAIKT